MEYKITLFDKQERFIFSEKPFSAYFGGFGNGKTMSGCIKAHQHCQQKDAFFLIGRRHATDLEDSTLRDFMELFRSMGKYSPGRKSFAFYKDGVRWSEVIFRHLDDMQSLTNMNLSGFWIDQAEEVSEDAFDFLLGRIRRPTVDRREGFLTGKPAGHDWIWRRFIKKKRRDGKILPDASDYEMIVASTLENRKNLPESYIRGLMSQPDSWVKRFVEGSFDTFSGQIFDEFSQDLHVIQPFTVPSGGEKIRGIDHGQSGEHATACLWMAIDYNGNCYVYQEYKKYNDIVSNHAPMINKMSKVRIEGQILDDHYSYTVIDPSTHAKNKVSKNGVSFSVADEYLDSGIATIGAQNDVIAGINRVKEYLKIDPEHYHPFKQEDGEPVRGAPHLYIFSSCTETIEEIQQYKWKQAFGVSTNSEADDIKERPRKKNDHTTDVLRYLIASRPQSPQHMTSIAPWVFQNPIELARRAQSMGLTVDDLMAQRYCNTSLRHSTSGISHSGGISHSNSSQWRSSGTSVGHQTGL